MKKNILLLFIALALIRTSTSYGQGIIINEIQSYNGSTIADENGDYSDWIELYNNGPTINLTGYGLSDDPTKPLKWTFPNISLESQQYLLVWASGKDRKIINSPLHTNFKIGVSGDPISLANPSGSIIDNVPPIALISDISYGRKPNGTGNFFYYDVCTPGTANGSTAYSEFMNPPTFTSSGGSTLNSGFYAQGFTLTLGSSNAGSDIYYTLDGSEPNPDKLETTYTYKNTYPENPGDPIGPFINDKSFRTDKYLGPISIADRSQLPNKISTISTTYDKSPNYLPSNPIFKGNIVRAKVIKPGTLSSPTITKTYFVTPQGKNRFTLPVLSLSINEDDLFDYYKGINVAGVDFDNWRNDYPTLPPPTSGNIANFFRRTREYEKIVNMSYFVDGNEVINQKVGLRNHGGSSRVAPDRSFVLYSRSEYGNKNMSYPFFGNKPFDNYSGIVLHNSGNDFDQTMFRDALCQELIRSLNVYTKGFQPSVIFINGEYWGILSLRDKVDDDFFQRVYNIPKNQIDALEDMHDVIAGDINDYTNLVDYLNVNSLATSQKYEYIKTRIDTDNFKDYFISNIFLGNYDWPMNNIVFWRKKTVAYEPNSPYGHDGRWRWQPHDMDATFANTPNDNINHNHLADATDPVGSDYPNPAWSTLILRRLLENNEFKIEFINRFADLLNTTFLSTRIISKMDEIKSILAPEMEEQFARWKRPYNNSDWEYFLDLEKTFAEQRPQFQRNHIRSKFGIASNVNVTLNVSDVNAGYIKINTINIKSGTDGITSNPSSWTGIYFSNIPVKIKAIPYPGYAFSHWEGNSTSNNPEITITPTSNINVTAVFVPEVTATSHPIYYWLMNSSIKDNYPLETLNSTYESGSTKGIIEYQSCLVGYPFNDVNVYWRKASLERRNNPTSINYFSELNNDLPFFNSDMKGLQVKEPLQNNGLENALVFNIPTINYKDIKFSFASVNENTNANSLLIDYSVNQGNPIWISNGFSTNNLSLLSSYQLYNFDFTAIPNANDNPNFKIRIRFAGSNMSADSGARITFNNIAVIGTASSLSVKENTTPMFMVFPNPVTNIINITSKFDSFDYKIISIEGKTIKAGHLNSKELDCSQLSSGLYLLVLNAEGKSEVKKIVKTH